MQALSHIERRRFDRLAISLHALGSRAVAELLIELATRAGCLQLALTTLARYAALTPGMMVGARADRTPSHPLRAVP